jgi:hypothetical protein
MSDLTNAHPDVDYARRLWDNTMYWYSSADTKAQVVLALDGAFLAFLSGTIFTKPSDLHLILAQFSVLTWSLLLLMLFTLLASMLKAILCLRSRMHSRKRVKKLVESSVTDGPYHPTLMWFFQFIEALDRDKFIASLQTIEPHDELTALANEIYIVSHNVREKHEAANMGFLLTVLTLVLFLVAALSYVIPLAVTP